MAGSRALRRPINSSRVIEAMFDAIAYEKGGVVLGMFEQFIGADRFRELLRAYVRHHAHGAVTTRDLVEAVARATSRPIAHALAAYADHDGTPVVELSLRCEGGAPTLIARVRGEVTVPVCVRYATPTGAARACALVGAQTELALAAAAAACPAWVIGNEGGRGYYELAWQGAPPIPPVAALTPAERLALGGDLAGSVRRAELPLAAAVGAVRALATSRDAHAQLAALAIAREIEQVVDDVDRPRWMAWLADQLRDRLTARAVFEARGPIALELRDRLLALVPTARRAQALAPRARAVVARQLARGVAAPGLGLAVAVAAARGGGPLFNRLLDVAGRTPSEELAATLLEALGWFGAERAPRLVDILIAGTHARPPLRVALIAMLGRPATRLAAWRALRDRLTAVLRTGSADDAHALVAATGALCDPRSRAEVVAAEPRLVEVAGARRTIADALDAIDACIARRAALGEILAALPR